MEVANPHSVVIFHSLPLHHYYEPDQEDTVDHKLKGLVTSSWTLDPLADFLASANVVSGEPAAGIVIVNPRTPPSQYFGLLLSLN